MSGKKRNIIKLIKNGAVAALALIAAYVNLCANASNNAWQEPINCKNINTNRDEFAPAISKKYSMYLYNSSSKGECKLLATDSNFSQAVFSNISQSISDFNFAPSYISFNDNYLLCSDFELYETRSHLNIKRSDYVNGKWSKSYLVSQISDNSFNAQSTISRDGSTIVFVSNRKSNNLDLWISRKNSDGEWQEPESIRELNSAFNEITPYFAGNDTIYFASNGFSGKGGYDIYYSIYLEGVWTRPEPIEELNTEFDESDFALISDTKAVFASNRPGGVGGLDLWTTAKKIEYNQNFTKNSDSLEILLECETNEINAIIEKKYIDLPIIRKVSFNSLSSVLSSITNAKYLNFELLESKPDLFLVYSALYFPIKSAQTDKKFPINFNFYAISDYSDTIKSAIARNFDIKPSEINLIYNQSKDEKISIESAYFEENEYFRYSPPKCSITPTTLNLSVNTRPNNNVRNCKLYIYTKDSFHLVESINKLPFSVKIDLKPYLETIAQSDYFELMGVFEDITGKIYDKKIKIEVSRKEFSEPYCIMKGAQLERAFYYLIDLEQNNFSQALEFINLHSGKKVRIKARIFANDKTINSKVEKNLKTIFKEYDLEIEKVNSAMQINLLKLTLQLEK